MTALQSPAGVAVGEVSWEDARRPGGWGHQLAIGVINVPDGTAVQLNAGKPGTAERGSLTTFSQANRTAPDAGGQPGSQTDPGRRFQISTAAAIRAMGMTGICWLLGHTAGSQTVARLDMDIGYHRADHETYDPRPLVTGRPA